MNKINAYWNEMEAQKLISEGKYHEALKLLIPLIDSGEAVDREALMNNLSICYLHFQEYEKAKVYLEKLVLFNEENSSSLFNLAFCLLSLKEYKESIRYFEKIKLKDGQSADVAFNLGFAYLGIRDVPRAMEEFGFLLKKPVSPALVYNVGIQLVGQGYPEEARQVFVAYLDLANNDIDATFGLGIAYSKLGEYRQAIECFNRVIEWDGKRYLSAYVSLAMAYFQIGDIAHTLKNLNTAVSMDPNMPEAWYYFGLVYEASGQLDKAMTSLKKAGELNHKMVEVWDKLGELCFKMKKQDEARISYKKAYMLTKDARYAYRIGLLALASKDYREAFEYFSICAKCIVKEEFSILDIFENLAVCSYYLGYYDKAAEYGERVLKERPERDILYFVMGSSLMKLGRNNQARGYLYKGLEIRPDDVNLLYSIGIMEGGEGNFHSANDFLHKALIIQRNPDIIYALALTKIKLDEKQAAAELLEEYQRFRQDSAAELYKLGLMFIDLGSYQRALKAFEKTLILEPNNTRAQEYLLSLSKKVGV